MDPEVNHPRTLALFRVVLYSLVLVVAVGLVGAGLSLLGVTVLLTGVSLLLTGDANALGFAVLAGSGLVTTVGLAAILAVVARRFDRYVTAADRRPDPLDELTRAYVGGDIDESTFERRVERILRGEGTTEPTGRLVRRALGSAHTRVRRRVRVGHPTPDREENQDMVSELTSP